MSDYLGRLVQRSLSPASGEVLTPRLPSLFETPGGDVSVPEPAPEEFVDDAFKMKFQEPTKTAFSPTVRTPVQNSALRLQAELSVSESHPTATTNEQNATAPHRPDSPKPSPPPTIRHEPTLTVRPLAAEPVSKAKLVKDEKQRPEIPAHLQPVTVEPLPVTRQERRAENVATATDQASGTTVHISIGRIEVRAVHPSQPSVLPRKPLPQPKLSIDEYARQRNGGKR